MIYVAILSSIRSSSTIIEQKHIRNDLFQDAAENIIRFRFEINRRTKNIPGENG
jgi:hypothetical protein